MIKQLLLTIILFALINHEFKAQISLTNSVHNYVIGDSYTIHTADTTGITPGANGAAITWNFSTLNINTTSYTYNTSTVASTTYTTDFPNATLAYEIGGVGSYDFFKISSTDRRSEGFVVFNTTVVPYYDDQILYTYPFTYNTTVTDSFKSNYVSGSNNVVRKGKSITKGVGYGNLILPGKTYNNVLKVSLKQNIADSFDTGDNFYSTLDTYYWYDANKKNPLLTITNTSSYFDFDPSNVDYNKVVSVNQLAVGIEEHEQLFNLEVFPNPCHTGARISFDLVKNSDVKISVVNVLGQVVVSKDLGISIVGKNYENLNLENLPHGFYIVKLDVGNDFDLRRVIVE